jgi:hypothetical protein
LQLLLKFNNSFIACHSAAMYVSQHMIMVPSKVTWPEINFVAKWTMYDPEMTMFPSRINSLAKGELN